MSTMGRYLGGKKRQTPDRRSKNGILLIYEIGKYFCFKN